MPTPEELKQQEFEAKRNEMAQGKKAFLEGVENDLAKNKEKLSFGIAKPIGYSNKVTNIERYMSYGSETFGKLGFNPFKDNEATYLAGTSSLDDLKRANVGMWKLAGVGFTDTFALGAFKSEDNASDFEDIMNKYSSTRNSSPVKFWANTMLSAGYTVGIMGAIAAEELLLAGLTAGVGNIGTAAEVGRAASNIGRGVDAAGDIQRTINNLENVEQARTWYNTLGKSTVDFGKSLLNPLAETTDFLTKANKIPELTGWKRTMAGAGAVVRDARKINMTLSESKLEADMKRNEYRNKLIDDYYKNNTEPLSSEKLKEIDKSANDVYNSVFKQNVGLIWATNAITFDNMFKNMRLSNRMFNVNMDGSFRQVGRGVNTTIEAVTESAFRKNIANPFFFKPLKNLTSPKWYLETAVRNSMEGIQEVSQDVIGEAAGKYHGDIYNYGTKNDKAKQGGYFDYLLNNFKFNAETFGSGFFMGTFAAPVGIGTQLLNEYTFGQKGEDLRTRLSNPEEWRTKQNAYNADLKRKAKLLTEVFRNAGDFIEHSKKPVVMQSLLQENILKAAEIGDRKAFEDKKAESFRLAVQTMLESGTEEAFINHLEYMGKNLSSEELNQVFGRTDITEANKAEYATKLFDKAEEVKVHKRLYDEIQDKLINPFKKPTKETDEGYLDYHAFEKLKSELVFNRKTIVEHGKRMKDLMDTSGMDTVTFSTLVNKTNLEQQINGLSILVEGSKDLELNQQQKEDLEANKKKLSLLQNYKKAYDEFERLTKMQKPRKVKLEKARADLFKAFDNYMNPDSPIGEASDDDIRNLNAYLTKGEEITTPEDLIAFRRLYTQAYPETLRARSKDSFEKVFDYLLLSKEESFLKDLSVLMLDPKHSSKITNSYKEYFSDLIKNKESHIYNSLKAFQDRAETEKALQTLLEEGLFIDMSEIDDLLEKGIMPSNVYNAETQNRATKEEFKKAQDILGSLYTRLTGKKLNYTRKTAQRSKDKKDDRSSEDLLDFFDFKLGVEYTTDDVLKKLYESPYFYLQTEKSLANFLLENTSGKIMFVDEAELPIEVEKGVIKIDIRNASSEYAEGTIPFETLVLNGVLQNYINERITNEPGFKSEVELLMKKVKEATTEEVLPRSLDLFKDPVQFMTEALNNLVFQKILKDIQDEDSLDEDNLFNEVRNNLKQILGKTNLDKSVIKSIYGILSLKAVEETEEEDQDVILETSSEEIPVEQADDLQNQLKELYKKRDDLRKEISGLNKITQFRKKAKLENELQKVSLEITKIKEKIKTLPEVTITEEPVIDTELAEIYEEMVNDGEVTLDVPFSFLPLELQNKIATALGLSVSEVTDEMYQNNADIINLISEYFAVPPVIEPLESDMPLVQGPLTPTQRIKQLFPKLNVSLLTDEEASKHLAYLADNNDLEHYQKVIKDIQRSNRKKTGPVEKPEINLFSLDNYNFLKNKEGKIRFYSKALGKARTIFYSKKDFNMLVTYYPELFTLPREEFLDALLTVYRNTKMMPIINLRGFELPSTDNERVSKILKEAIKRLQQNGKYNTAANMRRLNKALNMNNVPFIFVRKGNDFVLRKRGVRKSPVIKKGFVAELNDVLERAGVSLTEPENTIRTESQLIVYAIHSILISDLKADLSSYAFKGIKRISQFHKQGASSIGELADRIFDSSFNDLFQGTAFKGNVGVSILEDIFRNYSTKKELVNYANDLFPVIEENDDVDDLIKYQEELDAALLEEQANAYIDFLDSLLGQIKTGAYKGTLEDLEEFGEPLFIKAFLENQKKPEAEEEETFNPFEDFVASPVEQRSLEIEKDVFKLGEKAYKDAVEAGYMQAGKELPLFYFVRGLLDYKNTNELSLFDQYAFLKLISSKNVSNEQLTPFIELFLEGPYKGESVELKDGSVVTVIGEDSKKRGLIIRTETGENKIIGVLELASKVANVLESNQQVQKNDADTFVNEEENAYINQTYNEIFANFTKSVNEYDELDNQALFNKLSDELNKCK